LRILISGASGFIGKTLASFFRGKGYEVSPLVRKEGETGILFSFDYPDKYLKDLEGFDAFIHLAGENIAKGRWSQEKKKRIFDSRIESTKALSYAISKLAHPPKIFMTASAIGIFGDRKDEVLKEDSPLGTGFLSDVCKAWEEAATVPSLRCVQLRFGMVLGKGGGSLEKMLPAARLGLGVKLGSGEQFVSWIHIEDLANACLHLLEKDISGPVNISSPHPVKQKDFATALANVLKKPLFLSLPSWMLRLFLGEMAKEVLLTSIRARPEKLLHTGFRFQYPELKGALQSVLSINSPIQ